jgi:hypothetical protein
MDNLIRKARTTANKGITHVFMGNPMSDGCDKTTVEPGNTYSPGVWTCGISVWIAVDDELYSPDILPEHELEWGFAGKVGCPPILKARYPAGRNLKVSHDLAHLGAEGAEGVDFNEVTLTALAHIRGFFNIVVKDIGPAGGKIQELEWVKEHQTLTINHSLKLTLEQTLSDCQIVPADPDHDSPMAILTYLFDLAEGESIQYSFRTEHDFRNRSFGGYVPERRYHTNRSVKDGIAESIQEWQTALPVRVFAPDLRIAQVWERSAFHILSAMECGLPRIGAVNYPFFWMRDGVIILRAMDVIGRHDMARRGNDYLSSLYFSGGFGAESDAPSEGIWALVSHAKLNRDLPWLEEVFPTIVKRVNLIEQMLAAKEPIHMVGENRIPGIINTMGVNILCLPAQNGCIHGRMDWHSPDFYINAWAEGGLRLAAEAAHMLGKDSQASRWSAEAHALGRAVEAHLLPLYGNERDPVVAPYPTNALPDCHPALQVKFKEWFEKNRLTPEGKRNPERLWTYFEAAQIHNAILLGFKDLAWICLDGMLKSPPENDTSTYIEGDAFQELPFKNSQEGRGWLDKKKARGANMPHNWTSGELVNLIRTIFVIEEGDTLVLGKGVPPEWLKPGCKFGVIDMPTDLGKVSYTLTVGPDGKYALDYKGPENYRLDF